MLGREAQSGIWADAPRWDSHGGSSWVDRGQGLLGGRPQRGSVHLLPSGPRAYSQHDLSLLTWAMVTWRRRVCRVSPPHVGPSLPCTVPCGTATPKKGEAHSAPRGQSGCADTGVLLRRREIGFGPAHVSRRPCPCAVGSFVQSGL